MTAASFWSLLLPALELSEQMNSEHSKFYSIMPVVIGFLIGALFVHLTDVLFPDNVIYAANLFFS
jgi:zinc transporter ZupT